MEFYSRIQEVYITLSSSGLFFCLTKLKSPVAYKILFAIRRGKFEKGTNHYFFWLVFSCVYLIFDFFKSNKALIFGYSFNLFVSLVILLTIALISIYHFRSFIKKYGKKIFKVFYKKEKRKAS